MMLLEEMSSTPLGQDTVAALVVFSGEAESVWLRLLLKRGFRHCFIIIDKNDHWIIYNPRLHQTEIGTVQNLSVDKVTVWYESLGMTVVDSFVRPAPHRAAPWRPYTCVEAVKRVLGIQTGGILTPRQLYNHLIIENSKINLDLIK